MESISIGETHRIREFYYSADFASPWPRRILATNDTSPQPFSRGEGEISSGKFYPFSSAELACQSRDQDVVLPNLPLSSVYYNYQSV